MDKVICSNRSREVLKEYDEIHIIASSLIEGQNSDMLKMLDLLEQIRRNWDYEKVRAQMLQEELIEKGKENDGLRKEARMYKEQLRDARAQIATLMSDKKGMQQDIAELEKTIERVNDVLKDQSLLSEEDRQKLFPSLGTLRKRGKTRRDTRSALLGVSRGSSDGEEIDYDKTGDTMDMDVSSDDLEESRLRNGKIYRRSRSMVSLSKGHSMIATKRSKKSAGIDTVEEEAETPCKRSKDAPEATITTTATITVDAEGKKPPSAKIAVKRAMNRSISAANILDQTEETITLTPKAQTPQYAISTADLRTPLTGTKTWTNGASIETRPHKYANHNSILGDHCEVCNGWIGLVGKQAYKCCDCGIHIHKACVNNEPIPCVPRTPTPRTPGKQRPRLKDFCPTTQPMIPPILIHCVLALEKDRLSSEGIYRIPGDDTQVQKLLNEFQNGRTVPKLDYHDTETITSCIKQFLNKLRDPVVPTTSWEEFGSAVEANDMAALNQGIVDLPYPNRDTLAFLCAHFQKVCDNSIRNKMPQNVLARCIAASIVGPAVSRTLKVDEEAKQVAIMLALLRMPRDYWPKFYNFGRGMPLIRSPQCVPSQNDRTPARTPYKNPNKSILGPIETPPSGQEPNMYHQKMPRRKHFLGDLF